MGEFSATVIYRASTADYSLMYEKILSQHQDICDYVKTDDLKTQLLLDLDTRTKQDFVCLCTSEDLFYRPFIIPDLPKLFEDKTLLGFHTRLGKNIKRNTKAGADNIFKPEVDGKICIYDWTLHYVDFAEPFGINGSIYRTSEIRKIIGKIGFSTREELQEGFGMFGNYHRHKAACHPKSTLFTQARDANPKTAHITKMLTNIKLMKGNDYKPHDFDISNIEEVEKDIGVQKFLTKSVTK